MTSSLLIFYLLVEIPAKWVPRLPESTGGE